MKSISIAKDYSDTHLGRYPADGPFNGQRFREEYLRPALTENESVVVNIDDVEGYGSSFLEEAFGGLIRKGYFTIPEVTKKLQIVSSKPELEIYLSLIWKYVREAHKE